MPDKPAKAAFNAFYRTNYPEIVAQQYANTGSMSAAHKVAEKAFSRAWRHWNRVSTYDWPHAWVERVAFAVASSRMHTMFRGRGMKGAPPDPEAGFLAEALAQIPEEDRRVLILRHIGRRSVSEIALMEGIADSMIETRLTRGDKRVTALLTRRAVRERDSYA